VGKRIYRIKVRENMSVEEVVKNIEKMVGFPDSSLHEIVKNYFHNWQVRQQKLQMQSSA
jgi:deoxyhypusine synthase